MSKLPVSSRLARAQINWPWRTTVAATLAGVVVTGPVMTWLSGSAVVGWVLACAFGVFVGALARLSAHQTASVYPEGTDPKDFEEIKRIVRTGDQVRERRLAAAVLHMARRTLGIPFPARAFRCSMAVVALLGMAQAVLAGSWLGLAQAVLFGAMAVVLPPHVRRQRHRAGQAATHALEALGRPPTP